MYTYIYDSYLNDKKYQNALFRIESRLLELGINGRIEKLTILKSLKELVADAVDRKSETLVIVGNDETLTRAISFLPSHNTIVGMIPMGPKNEIAELLGIPQEVDACDTVSRRIIEHIDLGKANGQYFLSRLEIPDMTKVKLECNGYSISMSHSGAAFICNMDLQKGPVRCNPQDGVLEAVIQPTEDHRSFTEVFKNKFSHSSVFPITSAFLRGFGENVPVLADGYTTLKTPVVIEIAPKQLQIIVGGRRSFS